MMGNWIVHLCSYLEPRELYVVRRAFVLRLIRMVEGGLRLIRGTKVRPRHARTTYDLIA